VIVRVSLKNDSLTIIGTTRVDDEERVVGTTRVDDEERVNRDVIFDLESGAEEVGSVSSPVSTERFDNDEALCRMDAESLVRNIELVSDTVVPETLQGELSTIFDSPRNNSKLAQEIVTFAARCPLSDVMLTIYTTYHSPLGPLMFSTLDHSDVMEVIEAHYWMKPMMNYSFPFRLPEHCLFPTMSSRRRFSIVVRGIQDTPEHRPVASRFLDLIWLSTCEFCANEITSGYCTMALRFFLRLCPSCLKHHIIKISPNDGARLFRRQHFHGAQNQIHLSTDHTMLVSRLYCLKKQFCDSNNKRHGGPLRSQLLYSLGHPMAVPYDGRFLSEWRGAVEPILLHWCNEEYDINTDVAARFLNLDIEVINQMWDNMNIAVQNDHIQEITHLAHVFPDINDNDYNVLYRRDIMMVQPNVFLGINQLNFFASCAIQQIDNLVPGSIERFHALECGFMNHLYYHTPNVRNVYRYNSVRRWVKDIKIFDYEYVFIPTNITTDHWVLFVIVPAERRIDCYDSRLEAGAFHYESLSVLMRFIKEYQVRNNLQVDDWIWSVKIVCEPKQNNPNDCGVFVCMRMYCMMKGWDLDSIPVDAYNSRLRLFIAYSMLKWEIGTEDYSFSRLPAPLDNAFRLPYDGAAPVLY
jgi:hypothetical protein